MSNADPASKIADVEPRVVDGVHLATFPLHAILPGGTCACPAGASCPTAGKHPAYPYSELEPAEQLGAGPGGGYGIATGVRSGVFVVDLDIRPDEGKDGVAAFAALGSVPPTTIVETPTGGLHIYFRLPRDVAGELVRVKTSGGELGPGIDVRGEGGFVVGPGSPHRNGGVYTVLQDAEIADAPGWLVDLLTEARTPSKSTAGPSTRWEGDVSRWTRRAIDPASPEGARRIAYAREMIAKMPPSIEGQHGSSALLRTCIRLVNLELPRAACLELARTLPATPPWSDQEILHKLDDANKSDRTEIRGFPSEGWLERMRETPVFEPVDPAHDDPNAPLHEADPAHRATFTPGDEPANNDPKMISFTRAQADLWKHPEWTGVLGFDELRGHVVARNPPVRMDAEGIGGLSDSDVEAVRSWFEAHGHLITSDNVRKAIDLIARRRKFHPIREYLAGLDPADDEGREALDNFAAHVLGNPGALEAEMVKKTLVAAARRALTPGCKVDSVLVLVGPQGAKKSSLIETLFGDEYTKSQLPDIASKDASAELRTAWCVELAELASVRKADREALKAFISRRVDTYRPPYGRHEITSPRSSILIGTTNAPAFLEDATGGRRFWPLHVIGEIDLAWVRAHRDGIWAAAYELAMDPTYEHWFNDAAGVLDAVREQFEEQDAWHPTIRNYCVGREWVDREAIYVEALGLDLGKVSKTDTARVTDVLQRLACVSKPYGVRRVRRWKVPATLASEEPSKEEQKRRKAKAVVAKLADMADAG